MRKIWLVAYFQWFLLAVFTFGDIGFDHPGRFGLAFGDLLFIAFLFAIAFPLGIGLAIRKKAWGMLFAQIAVPLALYVQQTWPPPRFAPAQHQYLVGKTRAQVEKATHNAKPLVSSLQNDGAGERAVDTYRGMEVIYSRDKVVEQVRPASD